MSDELRKNDITTTREWSEDDVKETKKAHYSAGGNTRQAAPVPQQPTGLNQMLMNILATGKSYANFQGLDRCIRVLDPNTPNQRHCGAMMVKNSSTNQFMCSNCDRVRDPNARPRVINSSMIKLTGKDLEEFGMKEDPLANVKPEPVKPVKKSRKPKTEEPAQRRPKVAVPNSVEIKVTMKELQDDPNVVKTLLVKTLDAIYELPVKNFREAEEIRVVKERVETFIKLVSQEATQ